jgi:hypothetical protein
MELCQWSEESANIVRMKARAHVRSDMPPTQSRWTLVIGLMLAALGALLVWLRQPAPEIASTTPVMRSAPTAAPEVSSAAATPVPVAKQAPAAAAPVDETVGQATSTIHFERAKNKVNPAGRIDVNARYAVGVWQPGERRMRVLLMEKAPKDGESETLRNALQSGDAAAPPVTPAAVIDLKFIPTAQAFDRSELETASLTVTNAKGDSSVADVLGGLDWHGSLPSPAADGAPTVSQIQLGASGNSVSMDSDAWKQDWNFHVLVPVALIP